MTADAALLSLKHAVQALAAAPDAALAIHPDFVSKVDELALDFDHWLRVASSPDFTDRQKRALLRLDERLEAMSGQANAERWTEDALRFFTAYPCRDPAGCLR